MFAARAGAEVVAGQQDLRVAISGLVEDEVGVRGPSAGLLVAPGGEQAVGEAGLAGALHLPRRDDRVRVDVVAQQRGGAGGDGADAVHRT